MELFNSNQKPTFIYPGEKDQMKFWTKKWGVSAGQLNEAILETGSIRVSEIRKYLAKKGVVFSFSELVTYLKHFFRRESHSKAR